MDSFWVFSCSFFLFLFFFFFCLSLSFCFTISQETLYPPSIFDFVLISLVDFILFAWLCCCAWCVSIQIKPFSSSDLSFSLIWYTHKHIYLRANTFWYKFLKKNLFMVCTNTSLVGQVINLLWCVSDIFASSFSLSVLFILREVFFQSCKMRAFVCVLSCSWIVVDTLISRCHRSSYSLQSILLVRGWANIVFFFRFDDLNGVHHNVHKIVNVQDRIHIH